MRRTLAVTAVVIALVAAAAAQSATPAPSTASTIEALLEEVRALRADLQRNSSAGIRAQLLVARLQLQEQRINTAARDLADVQNQLLGVAQDRVRMTREVRNLEGDLPPDFPAERRREVRQMAEVVKAQLQAQEQREQALRQQEVTLTGLIAEDQARWADFNNRLDDLERALAAPAR